MNASDQSGPIPHNQNGRGVILPGKNGQVDYAVLPQSTVGVQSLTHLHDLAWAISHGQRNNSASFSDGFIQPSVCRGRSLSMCATRFRCRWLWTDKSLPLGKY